MHILILISRPDFRALPGCSLSLSIALYLSLCCCSPMQRIVRRLGSRGCVVVCPRQGRCTASGVTFQATVSAPPPEPHKGPHNTVSFSRGTLIKARRTSHRGGAGTGRTRRTIYIYRSARGTLLAVSVMRKFRFRLETCVGTLPRRKENASAVRDRGVKGESST